MTTNNNSFDWINSFSNTIKGISGIPSQLGVAVFLAIGVLHLPLMKEATK